MRVGRDYVKFTKSEYSYGVGIIAGLFAMLIPAAWGSGWEAWAWPAFLIVAVLVGGFTATRLDRRNDDFGQEG